MHTQDDYERIEAWLDGLLPEAEKQAFERQMEIDDAFRREVKSHRLLHWSFGDRELLQFKNALERVMKEPAPPDETLEVLPPKWNRRWLFGGLFIAIAAALIVAVWQMNRPVDVQPSPTMEKNTPAPAPPSPTIEKPSTEPKKSENRPIAQANSTDFTPNRAMDMMVDGNVRGDIPQPEITSPTAPDTSFSMDKNGLVKIRFSGKSDGGQAALELSICNNRDSRNPVFSAPFEAPKGAAGQLNFDFFQSLRLPPGLYYFFLRERQSGGLLGAGRFTVHTR